MFIHIGLADDDKRLHRRRLGVRFKRQVKIKCIIVCEDYLYMAEYGILEIMPSSGLSNIFSGDVTREPNEVRGWSPIIGSYSNETAIELTLVLDFSSVPGDALSLAGYFILFSIHAHQAIETNI